MPFCNTASKRCRRDRAAPVRIAADIASILKKGMLMTVKSKTKIILAAAAVTAALTCSGCDFWVKVTPPAPETSPETGPVDLYAVFQKAVDENPYDLWLTAAKAEGQMPYDMYADYLSFWKAELHFTMIRAESLFGDPAEYRTWKTRLSEWLASMEETLRLEMGQMDTKGQMIEVIIPHCRNVRQKVIDTKYFCYVMQTSVIPGAESSVVLTWKWTYADLNKVLLANEAEAAFDAVMRGDRKLYHVARHEEVFLQNYTSGVEPPSEGTEGYAASLDLDGDGIPERLIADDSNDRRPGKGETIILRYENGAVYGHTFGFSHTDCIYSDGTMSFGDAQGFGRCRLRFVSPTQATPDGLEKIELVYERYSDVGEKYYVSGTPVDQGEFTEQMKTLSDEEITWLPVTLPGDPFLAIG